MGITRMIRLAAPRAQITVATADPQTTAKDLGVQTCPPFGFDVIATVGAEVQSVMADQDLLIWPGATGLSDYPEIPLSLLGLAQRLKKKTAVICVGMSDELNANLYQVRSRWRPTYDLIRKATGSWIDMAAWIEAYRKARTYHRLRSILPKTDLVVVRNQESAANLRRIGVKGRIGVGADAALLLQPRPLQDIRLPETLRLALTDSRSPRLGLCLSSQEALRDFSAVIRVLDRLMAETGTVIFAVPINPRTDGPLMRHVLSLLKFPNRVYFVEGIQDPEDVAGVLGQMEVIVSSRLHGLILGSLSDVPLVGIRRGSKIDDFLRPFGRKPAGSVQCVEPEELQKQIWESLEHAVEFRERARALRVKASSALETTVQSLKSLLGTDKATSTQGFFDLPARSPLVSP